MRSVGPKFRLNRRDVLAGGAAASAAVLMCRPVAAANRRVGLAIADSAVDRDRLTADADLSFDQGTQIDLALANNGVRPARVMLRAVDGLPSALQPGIATPIAPGASLVVPVSLLHAGTAVLELWPDGAASPIAALPLVVREKSPPPTDLDLTWVIAANGDALRVNDVALPTIPARPNARLRLRLIDAVYPAPLLLRIPGQVQVIAIDGQPAEPFLAQEGVVVMLPGNRIDVLCDLGTSGVSVGFRTPTREGTLAAFQIVGEALRTDALPVARALPPNGLPDRLPLASAQRVTLDLDAASRDKTFFTTEKGRVVVLTLQSASKTPQTVRLGGHHARLLDRLDDGWKPYWVDTVLVGTQPVRLAFAAMQPGVFGIEAQGLQSTAAPRLWRYSVGG